MREKNKGNGNRNIKTVIIITAIIALIAVPLYMFRSLSDTIVDEITQTISLQYSRELNTQMSAHISSTIDYYFHELNNEYSALKLVEDLDEEKLISYIAETEENNDISYIAFADDDGFVYEADGSYLGTMRVSMLGNMLGGAQCVVSDNVTIGSESYTMFGSSFGDPIEMGEKTISIGILGMDNDDLAEHIVLHSDYSGGYSSIINTDGSYVVKNPAETKNGLNVFSIIEKNYNISDEDLSALKNAINSGETYFYSAKHENEEYAEYMYFAPVEGTQWYIVNTLPSSFIKNSVLELRDTIEMIYVIFVALLLIVAVVIVSQQVYSRRKLKKSGDELEMALQKAEEASGAKTDFLFSMSHDIRTPMNAILGYTDIGLKHTADEEISKDSFQKIKMAGGHLLNLINDILEMSRIESGKMELNEKPIDIRDSIADITTMSQSLAVAKSIDYETVIENLENPYIYADELHINEVIINIISNAVKYTQMGGKVRYTISQTGEVKDGKANYHFEVSDNGIGMSEEFQRHLFETFSREETTTVSKTEGTGLGLSIVKKIVDMAGGEITVHSVQGQGSTFIVDIPFRVLDQDAVKEFETQKQEKSIVIADVSFEGMKVLLTEDNELNREIAGYILEDAGFEIDTAEDGNIAVSKVAEKGTDYYDFILMDIQMPVMNGYEATKKIREMPGGDRIPVIALSANAFEEDKKKSIEAGMNAHVAKPIDTKTLLETMHSLKK